MGCPGRDTPPAPGLAIAGTSLEHNGAATPGGFLGAAQTSPLHPAQPSWRGPPGERHRPLPTRPGHPGGGRGFRGTARTPAWPGRPRGFPGPTKAPAKPPVLGGSRRGQHGTQAEPAPVRGCTERQGQRSRPHANPHSCPAREGPGGVTSAPSPEPPTALGLERAARGLRPGRGRQTRGPGRRAVLTGTDILASAPGPRAGSGAGRLGAPVRRAAQSPPRGVPALSGFPAGSCALPAAGLSGGSSPRRACAAPPLPLPSPPRGPR